MKGRSHALVIAIAVVVLILIAGVSVYSVVSGKLGKMQRLGNEVRIDPSEESFEQDEDGLDANAPVIEQSVAEGMIDPSSIKLMTDENVVNILFIGRDASDPEGKDRSDSIIICSLDRRAGSIKLVSLLRDMYVKIPGYSSNRLNAAYMFGGAALLDEAIEENFGVRIDGNVAVDFGAFMDCISRIGFLEIELTAEEAEYINTFEEIEDNPGNLTEGLNVMSPIQVLTYARIRKVGHSDWERTERQRRVISTAFEAVKDMKLSEQIALADKLLPFIATDMDDVTILNLVRLVYAGHMQIEGSFRIPADGTWQYASVNGMSVIIPELESNSSALKQYLYGAAEN